MKLKINEGTIVCFSLYYMEERRRWWFNFHTIARWEIKEGVDSLLSSHGQRYSSKPLWFGRKHQRLTWSKLKYVAILIFKGHIAPLSTSHKQQIKSIYTNESIKEESTLLPRNASFNWQKVKINHFSAEVLNGINNWSWRNVSNRLHQISFLLIVSGKRC